MIQVRSRLTDRMNRARLALEVKRASRSAVTVVIALAGSLAIGGYIIEHTSATLLASTHQVSFLVNDATAVKPGVQGARFEGIPAGNITNVAIDGSTPMITVTIDTKYGPIYRNARAELRPNTALQDMYLDITDRGTPSAGLADPSNPLPVDQTSTSVNIDDVLNTFNPDVRGSLRTLLDSLGQGLRDRGRALRTAFAELVPFLQVVGRISHQVQDRASITKALVHNAAELTSDLAQRQTELRTLVSRGSVLVRTLQSGSPDLSATLHELPLTLSTINVSFAAVRGVLGDVNRAVTGLYPVADRLRGGLAQVRRLNGSAGPAVHALDAPVGQLVPVARALLPVSGELRRIVTALTPLTHTVDRTTKDLVACKQGVQGFFQWDASLTKFGDVRGPAARGNLALGATASGLVPDPSEFPVKSCTPGPTVGGRVPTAQDLH
jgi:phospholipid/cholesterol/gamma-HCH transport system substrate-binding protein